LAYIPCVGHVLSFTSLFGRTLVQSSLLALLAAVHAPSCFGSADPAVVHVLILRRAAAHLHRVANSKMGLQPLQMRVLLLHMYSSWICDFTV